jgi:hypothetical protein
MHIAETEKFGLEQLFVAKNQKLKNLIAPYGAFKMCMSYSNCLSNLMVPKQQGNCKPNGGKLFIIVNNANYISYSHRHVLIFGVKFFSQLAFSSKDIHNLLILQLRNHKAVN